MRPLLTGAVEGETDDAVLRRLARHVGLRLDTVYGTDGKANLRRRLPGFNQAAQLGPWAVLVDLDQDFACAPHLVEEWLPVPAASMCFRVAVREIEAWLLADRERMADLLGVSVDRLPLDPEALDHPKEALVTLARKSRKRQVREALVPRETSGRKVGPGYTATLINFARDEEKGWRPERAALLSDSLRRCLDALRRLAESGDSPG